MQDLQAAVKIRLTSNLEREKMRSPFVALEEWLFKQLRRNLFSTWQKEIEQAATFKRLVLKTNCPACEKPLLKLVGFERGPKGYEATVICEGCQFHGMLNSSWTKLQAIDSKGRAREK